MNVHVHSNGTPINRKSRIVIFVSLVAVLVILNLMFGLFTAVSGGCFRVLDFSISEEYVTIFNGDSYQLGTEVLSTGSGTTSFSWKSSSPDIVTVDETGKITAKTDGSATVTVTELGTGKEASCKVTVLALSSMDVEQSAFTLGVGEQSAISAFSGNGRTVEYTSSDPAVVSVSEDGTITAFSVGSAQITVSAVGCEKKICTVEVKKAPAKITFDVSLEICVGETRQISASTAEDEHSNSFELSTDSSIIEISEDGVLTAVSAGTATITAKAYNGAVGSGKVTVRNAPSSLSIKISDSSLYTGDTATIKPKENTGFCEQFTYSTSDPAVASVDENGVVTANGKGSAVISCETYNGIKATCKVEVGIVDHTTPYTSKRVERDCKDLVNAYPELISMSTIGTSTCGTDIILLKVGTGEKKALVTGGIHSREDITVNYVMRCVEEYAEAYYSKTGKYGSFKLKQLLEEWTLYVVPLMNPDGIDIVNDGMIPLYKNGVPLNEQEMYEFKNTSTGVNLNRNFPFEWNASTSLNYHTPNYDSYIGSEAGSEPETKAIMKLCAENAFEWLFSFHIKGNMLYWRDAVNKDAEKAELLSNRLVVNCGFNLMRTSTVVDASGGMENWFRQQYNKPGFCIELMDDRWSSDVNQYFEKKVNWSKTRYAIVLGMVYG